MEYSKIKDTNINQLNHFDITKQVKFGNKDDGDSVVEAIKRGGVILNPANENRPGGGVYNNDSIKAMEENLCRESNLITTLLLAHKKLKQSYKEISTEQKKNTNNYLGKAKNESQKCILSNNRFMYIQQGTSGEYFKKLKSPADLHVLTIASADMRRIEITDITITEYKRNMKQYWEFAIKSTIEYCKAKNIKPKLIAVTPGVFILFNSALATIAAQALKEVLQELKANIEIIFARVTDETKIFKEVMSNGDSLSGRELKPQPQPRKKKRQSQSEKSDLQRFIDAQKNGIKTVEVRGVSFEDAIKELKAILNSKSFRSKEKHYIWYVLPQLKGIIPGNGGSDTTKYYSIKDYTEAIQYLKNPDLSNNYFEYIRLLDNILVKHKKNLSDFFSHLDDKKYQSSFVLFLLVSYMVGDSYPISKQIQNMLIKIFRREKEEYQKHKNNTIRELKKYSVIAKSIEAYDKQSLALINESTTGETNEKLEQLKMMGFNENKARAALSKCNNNITNAIEDLLNIKVTHINTRTLPKKDIIVFFDLDDTLILKCDHRRCRNSKDLVHIGDFDIGQKIELLTKVYTTINIKKMLKLLHINNVNWTVISAGNNEDMFRELETKCKVKAPMSAKFNVNNKDFKSTEKNTKGYQINQLSRGAPFIFCDDSYEQIGNVILQNPDNMIEGIHANGKFHIDSGWETNTLSKKNCERILELCGIQIPSNF